MVYCTPEHRFGSDALGQGVGRVLALGALGKIGRIARTNVKLPFALPPQAQVGTHRGNMAELLLCCSCRQQCAALGLQLQRRAGAAVAPVVPFQRHDAAAGTQVCRVVNADSCIDCGACEGACPTGAIAAE